MNGNIYITGFMGVGKSTVGKALSKLLKRPLIDMDKAISRRSGLSIRSYFKQLGEERFRRAETELLKDIASNQRLVVATGGGLPVNPENRAIMRSSGKVIHLDMPLDNYFRRLGNGSNLSRPKWTDRDSVEALSIINGLRCTRTVITQSMFPASYQVIASGKSVNGFMLMNP